MITHSERPRAGHKLFHNSTVVTGSAPKKFSPKAHTRYRICVGGLRFRPTLEKHHPNVPPNHMPGFALQAARHLQLQHVQCTMRKTRHPPSYIAALCIIIVTNARRSPVHSPPAAACFAEPATQRPGCSRPCHLSCTTPRRSPQQFHAEGTGICASHTPSTRLLHLSNPQVKPTCQSHRSKPRGYIPCKGSTRRTSKCKASESPPYCLPYSIPLHV